MIELEATSVGEFLRALLRPNHISPRPTGAIAGSQIRGWGLVPSIRRKKSWDSLGGAERFNLTHDGILITSPEDDLAAIEAQLLFTLTRVIERTGRSPDLAEGDRLLAFANTSGYPRGFWIGLTRLFWPRILLPPVPFVV